MTAVRELIKKGLDTPAILDRLADEDDFAFGGVDSGELIRVAMQCEEVLGRALTGSELAGLTSVRAVAALLGEDC